MFAPIEIKLDELDKDRDKQDHESNRAGSTVGWSLDPVDPRETGHNQTDEACKRNATIGCLSETIHMSPIHSPEPLQVCKALGLRKKVTSGLCLEEQETHLNTLPQAQAAQTLLVCDPPLEARLSEVSKPSKLSKSTGLSKPSKLLHLYNTCPTLYELCLKQHGGCVKIMVNGKEKIAWTPIECLIHCKAKYKYVLKNSHLFGNKHGCYFNPYSKSHVNNKNCKQIAKPAGFQIGCRGPQSLPWHWEIGLCNDYNYAMDICLQGTHEVSAQIFRSLTSSHLTSNSSDTRASKNTKPSQFLKCNALTPEEKDLGEGSGEDLDGYKDNYILNSHCYANATQTALTSQSSTSQSLTKKQSHANNDKFISSKKQKHQSYSKDKDNEDKDNEDKDNKENNKDQDTQRKGNQLNLPE
ncbi:hypothetical protein RHS01_10145 [Rhizoctonia solani]|uniref:Uncharacterized protein n=1 Tax=Rhizoctonia solani TaxID=456999 RepID=A0A8H7M0S1_9AGAM|nr:hypothetical protein RHS01_10145 [Rhizoctonia solani]